MSCCILRIHSTYKGAVEVLTVRVAYCLLLLVLDFLTVQSAWAAQVVKVGAYNFPPYVLKAEGSQPQGLLPDLLTVLNQQQDDYLFELVPTSVTRRYRDFQHARFDIMLFESKAWGWKDIPLTNLDLQVEDAEIYVAKAEPGRTQAYFEQLKGKRLALYTGYHYGFANFNADPEYLAREFNAMLNYSHESNLLMVQRGRADVTVVTRSYLHSFETMFPEQRGQLLTSSKVDQIYHHEALLRPQAPISAAALGALLQQLRTKGLLSKLYAQYQLRPSGSIAQH
jgi:ABC-type amino acid transport substrate-binding protein